MLFGSTRSRRPGLSVVLAGLLFLFLPGLQAQEVTAAITGTVTDPSGAAVVGVKITAKDLDRGTAFPTTTSNDGYYSFPRLPIGRYEVRAENPGFQTTVQSDIVLQLNQNARVDLQLKV